MERVVLPQRAVNSSIKLLTRLRIRRSTWESVEIDGELGVREIGLLGLAFEGLIFFCVRVFG